MRATGPSVAHGVGSYDSGKHRPQAGSYRDSLALNSEALIDRIFQMSPHIRYVAVRRNGQLAMRQRDGVDNASEAESDRYEELLVNPTLLTLATQRGDIDCGGLRYVLVRYGNFFQCVRSFEDGHVSVAIEAGADVVGIAGQVDALLGRGKA